MTVRVKRPFCVGLDVHKNNVWASVIIHSPDKPKAFHATRKFASNHHCLMELVNWIKSFQTAAAVPCDEIHVYMESTGKYSTPVYNVLEECGLIPHLVNPKNVRTISGQKTDQKDCEWIAELGSFGLLILRIGKCRSKEGIGPLLSEYRFEDTKKPVSYPTSTTSFSSGNSSSSSRRIPVEKSSPAIIHPAQAPRNVT